MEIQHFSERGSERDQPFRGSALCSVVCPLSRAERRGPDADPAGAAAAMATNRPERRSGVRTRGGLGSSRGCAADPGAAAGCCRGGRGGGGDGTELPGAAAQAEHLHPCLRGLAQESARRASHCHRVRAREIPHPERKPES